MAETILRVEHLSQYFNKDFKAVDDVSFEIKKGEVYGLVGESGSGKTTIGRSIIKLYKITGGKIYFNDKLINAGTLNVTDKNELKQIKLLQKKNQMETKIQMIFQDPVSSLNPRMNVREIISEGLRIQGETNEKVIDEKVFDVMNKVGLLKDYANRYPHEFSGGQRQRIGIARALIMKPKLIIADEPVSALDVSIKAQIINLLNDLRKELSLSILFIAHDLAIVKYFCDRIGVMYKGKIVEQKTSDELFANPEEKYTKALLRAIPVPDPDASSR